KYYFFSSRRRHTRSKRDWSSDVCSSDLVIQWPAAAAKNLPPTAVTGEDMRFFDNAAHAPACEHRHGYVVGDVEGHRGVPTTAAQDRKSVVQGKRGVQERWGIEERRKNRA